MRRAALFALVVLALCDPAGADFSEAYLAQLGKAPAQRQEVLLRKPPPETARGLLLAELRVTTVKAVIDRVLSSPGAASARRVRHSEVEELGSLGVSALRGLGWVNTHGGKSELPKPDKHALERLRDAASHLAKLQAAGAASSREKHAGNKANRERHAREEHARLAAVQAEGGHAHVSFDHAPNKVKVVVDKSVLDDEHHEATQLSWSAPKEGTLEDIVGAAETAESSILPSANKPKAMKQQEEEMMMQKEEAENAMEMHEPEEQAGNHNDLIMAKHSEQQQGAAAADAPEDMLPDGFKPEESEAVFTAGDAESEDAVEQLNARRNLGAEHAASTVGGSAEWHKAFVKARFDNSTLLHQVSGENINGFLNKNEPFVMFLLCECERDDDWDLIMLEKLIRKTDFPEKTIFLYADVETYHRFQLSLSYGIALNQLPALVIDNIPMGPMNEKYVFHLQKASKEAPMTEDVTTHRMMRQARPLSSQVFSFISSFWDGTLQPTVRSQPRPEGDSGKPLFGQVTEIVGDSFMEVVADPAARKHDWSTGKPMFTFVLFYAQFCGGSQQVLPILDAVASRLKRFHSSSLDHVVVSKMEDNDNDSPLRGIKVSHFPTAVAFKVAKKGAKIEIIPYNYHNVEERQHLQDERLHYDEETMLHFIKAFSAPAHLLDSAAVKRHKEGARGKG